MFGIGPQELILILVGALIIFGPQRLPEIAAQIGKTIRDVRRMSDDLTGEFQRSMNLDEPTPPPTPPVLTSGVIPADSTPNGIGDAIAQSLRVETVPTETAPTEEKPSTEEQIPLASESNTQQDTVISLSPMATKTDALVGVSLLDEPTPYVGETSKEKPEQESSAESTAASALVAAPVMAEADATPVEAAPADAGSYVYQPSAVSDSAPLALDAAPEPTNEADAVRAQSTIADAWDAVITTEATTAVAVAEPEVATEAPPSLYPADTYAAASGPFPAPERERVDPAAEPTIREKIESQVAAEAFRERRRLAHYQRTRNKNS